VLIEGTRPPRLVTFFSNPWLSSDDLAWESAAARTKDSRRFPSIIPCREIQTCILSIEIQDPKLSSQSERQACKPRSAKISRAFEKSHCHQSSKTMLGLIPSSARGNFYPSFRVAKSRPVPRRLQQHFDKKNAYRGGFMT
jgi:hypothetical protein